MGTVIVSLLLLGLVGGIIAGLIRSKKSGKACCGGCSSCPHGEAGGCRKS